MTIMEVSLLTGFYPNQDDLKQVMSRAGMSWKPPTPPEWVQSACLWVKAPRLMPPRSVPPRSVAMVNFSLTSALIVPQFPQHWS